MGKKLEKHGDLEIEGSTAHHHRAWQVKRAAWGIMTLLVAAALAGLLGPGPLSKGRLNGPSQLQLEYDKIVRYNAPTHFKLRAPGGTEDLKLSLNYSFVEQIDIERINPEPKEMRLDGEKHTWIFARTEKGPSTIQITFKPEGFGPTPARLDIEGVGRFDIKPFFLP